jgi:rod shape-determining protein MreC
MKNKRKVFFGITVVIVAFVFLHYIGWLNPAESFIKSLFNPLVSKIYSISADTVGPEFKTQAEWEAGYKEMQLVLEKLQSGQATCSLLKDEVSQLKQQLDFLKENNYRSVGAHVIGRNIDPLGSALLIDRGAEDGLEMNQPAIVGAGLLIGIVAEVDKNTAIVRLINDGESKVAVTLMNKDRSIGLVEGGFGISVRMNMIPQNEPLAIDDLVITSGLTPAIPRGLIVGTVEAIERESYQPFQKAIIKPSAALDKITDVSVIIQDNYEDS